MDLGLLAGLGLALAAILGADLMDGGSIANLINPSAAVLVIGGTLGATVISSRLEDVVALPGSLLALLRPVRLDLAALVEQMAALALKARRNGLLALEEDVQAAEDPFVARGLRMIVDGAEGQALESVLRTDMVLRERAEARQAALLETAGGFAPTMGIIGTVMGLIHVLGNLANVGALGPSIATAFLATFYGISTANVFWLPLSAKVRQRGEALALARELALEGLLSIQAGDNPSTVRDKLSVFLQAAGTAAPGSAAAPAATQGAPAAPKASGSPDASGRVA